MMVVLSGVVIDFLGIIHFYVEVWIDFRLIHCIALADSFLRVI